MGGGGIPRMKTVMFDGDGAATAAATATARRVYGSDTMLTMR